MPSFTKDRYPGVVVPMVTPVTPAGEIDEPAAARIVERLVTGGCAGVFPLGTTGECVSVPADDKRRLVDAVVKANRGRATVYAGVSSNCFRESVDLAKAFKAAGADFVVAHAPSYYPLSDADIEAYFARLADAVPLPLLLYNIPVTTHHTIALPVVDRLRRHPNVVAIKDSAGDADRLTELLKMTGGRDGFPVLLGSSQKFAHGLRHGGVGLIPSGGHLVPELYRAMFDAAMADRWPEVEELQVKTEAACAPYNKGRPLGESLAVLKALCEKRGLCGRSMLPPLRDFTGEVPA